MTSENSSEGDGRIEVCCTNSISYEVDEYENEDDCLVAVVGDWNSIGEENSAHEFKQKSEETRDYRVAGDTSCSLHYII